MLIAILVCIIIGFVISIVFNIKGFLILKSNFQDLFNNNKSTLTELNSVKTQVSQSQRSLMDLVKNNCTLIENKLVSIENKLEEMPAKVPPLVDPLIKSVITEVQNQSSVIHGEINKLTASNVKIANHISIYSAVIESQERLIEAVDSLALKQTSRRHG